LWSAARPLRAIIQVGYMSAPTSVGGWGLSTTEIGAVLSGEGRAVPIDDGKGVNVVNISSN